MSGEVYAHTSMKECGVIYLSWKIEDFLDLSRTRRPSISGPDVILPTKPTTTWKTFIDRETLQPSGHDKFIFRAQTLKFPEDDEKKIEIRYELSFLETKSGNVKYKGIVPSGSNYTVRKAIAYTGLNNSENVNNFLTGKDLVLKCCFRVLEFSTSCFVIPENSLNNLLESFRALHSSKTLSDFTIILKDKVIPVHKCILASRSPVFAAMFESETSEMLENKLVVQDCDSKTMETFILYLYTGELGECTAEECFQLYTVSDKYALECLKNTCAHKLVECINVHNACDVYALGHFHNDAALKTAAKIFISRNKSSVLETESWRKITLLNSQLAAELRKETGMT